MTQKVTVEIGLLNHTGVNKLHNVPEKGEPILT